MSIGSQPIGVNPRGTVGFQTFGLFQFRGTQASTPIAVLTRGAFAWSGLFAGEPPPPPVVVPQEAARATGSGRFYSPSLNFEEEEFISAAQIFLLARRLF